MDQELLDLTYQACEAFTAQTNYKRLLDLKEEIHKNPEINELVIVFQKAKKNYEEAKAYGTYHPDLARYQKAFQEAKVTMMSHEIIKEYKSLERVLQKQLDQLSIDLAEAVSPNIKHPNMMNIMNVKER